MSDQESAFRNQLSAISNQLGALSKRRNKEYSCVTKILFERYSKPINQLTN